jgi:L-lactate utilization protein LutC
MNFEPSLGGRPASRDLVVRAQEAFAGAGWQVLVAKELGEAREYLLGIAQRAGKVAVCPSPAWRELDPLAGMEARGVDVRFYGEGDPRGDRRFLFEAGVGVTGATALAAATGTAFLAGDDGHLLRVSNVPYEHVVVAFADTLVATLQDGLATVKERSLELYGSSVPRYLGLVSGPSRTGDIEFIIVQGMHGPGRVHLVLLDLPAGGTAAEERPA